ncbi:MAG: TIGR03557 family F420-dependent LLM class oxidoreductase [Nitrososphaerota archaeon]|nr:TIGR03557 family F420-dependent LLM class oxidoreductase [Nitrososphaerota archaeon]
MKLELGYLASQEQYSPSELLRFAQLAAKVGFQSIWTSDHFHPWIHTKSQSGFAWTWLGALGATTNAVKFGTGVTCPLFRYNPAIVAQAFATMDSMFPGRVFLGVGTGEALNEVPMGYTWPEMSERRERLIEAIKIIKLLWSGNRVNFDGEYYKMKKASLYTRPKSKIPLYVAASGPKMAEVAGIYSDGLLTLPFDDKYIKDQLLAPFDDGARKAGRDPSLLPRLAEVWISYHRDYDKALKSCRFWAATLLPFMFTAAIYDPKEIEQYSGYVSDEAIAKSWCIATSPEDQIRCAERFIRLGFSDLHFSSSSPNEEEFIRVCGTKVLPYLKNTYGEPKHKKGTHG